MAPLPSLMPPCHTADPFVFIVGSPGVVTATVSEETIHELERITGFLQLLSELAGLRAPVLPHSAHPDWANRGTNSSDTKASKEEAASSTSPTTFGEKPAASNSARTRSSGSWT